jgi:hypothetical protein
VAGELYTLTCLIRGTNLTATFQWKGPDGNISTMSMNPKINSSSLYSVLRFFPVHTSHGGEYTCEARGKGTASVIVNCMIGIVSEIN